MGTSISVFDKTNIQSQRLEDKPQTHNVHAKLHDNCQFLYHLILPAKCCSSVSYPRLVLARWRRCTFKFEYKRKWLCLGIMSHKYNTHFYVRPRVCKMTTFTKKPHRDTGFIDPPYTICDKQLKSCIANEGLFDLRASAGQETRLSCYFPVIFPSLQMLIRYFSIIATLVNRLVKENKQVWLDVLRSMWDPRLKA